MTGRRRRAGLVDSGEASDGGSVGGRARAHGTGRGVVDAMLFCSRPKPNTVKAKVENGGEDKSSWMVVSVWWDGIRGKSNGGCRECGGGILGRIQLWRRWNG
ncbi:hypothetical protein M0R45_002313 [Rubus argutus]|uniref:Uncharacterized protein n=1 Tax=Rubus argutus TaxID=59490 RepID=A0AAW1VIM9_RUBAR